ncbi:hypothetical protein Q765_10250 [Flavobacterium rivuli WB 3.3-2 = DSM 21788]|uniref:Uncharacterized protein n=1 Tax=Flavobacterium rivuli WB 3.3-2 = DSM 21788 TaxID=1121895 RepID=A0A0A2M4R3_9FLAO|nr:hypothetical protein [Flavobacterium rivuli]KGO86596.1 hypothetical protein Q765_10250 [Flavobacterium rivuli WB 3.3-2 = DSM 21788]
MEKFRTNGFYLLTLFGFMAFTTPFIKYPSSVKITDANPLYIHYEKLSGIDMVWESVAVLFNPADKLYEESGIVSGIVALLIAIVLLVQFAGVVFKKRNLIFYSAIVLFAAFLVNLMLLAKEGFVTVRWGYFIYLIIEAAIILLIPFASKKQPKNN